MEEASEHTLKLIKKERIANKTMAFYFEKPEGFSFVPGQSMDLFYPKKDEKKTFSIASAPYEKYLLFAMRLRGSPFKKYLSKMKTGDTIAAAGPFGERFVLPEDAAIPLVFIAGGIGITPILSMISHVMHEGLPYNITLFYSNRKEEDVAFLGELNDIISRNKNIKLILTLTGESPPGWEGETGRVNAEMIKKYVSDIQTLLFYGAGPPLMVVGMKDTLEKAGVPTDHILTKKFTGYE